MTSARGTEWQHYEKAIPKLPWEVLGKPMELQKLGKVVSNVGEDEPILTSIFFKWVVQPPTS